MNRRNFLKLSGASLGAVCVAPLSWAAPARPRLRFLYHGTSAQRVLDEAGVQELQVKRAADPFGSYEFEGTPDSYFFWWFPASAPQPRAGNGFFMAPVPISMASGVDGFDGGPVNGWRYVPLTVDCIPGFLFRSYYPIGNNDKQTVLVQ